MGSSRSIARPAFREGGEGVIGSRGHRSKSRLLAPDERLTRNGNSFANHLGDPSFHGLFRIVDEVLAVHGAVGGTNLNPPRGRQTAALDGEGPAIGNVSDISKIVCEDHLAGAGNGAAARYFTPSGTKAGSQRMRPAGRRLGEKRCGPLRTAHEQRERCGERGGSRDRRLPAAAWAPILMRPTLHRQPDVAARHNARHRRAQELSTLFTSVPKLFRVRLRNRQSFSGVLKHAAVRKTVAFTNVIFRSAKC